MAAEFLLFTTPTCPKCPAAKKLLEQKGVKYELVDASKPDGLDKARKFQIVQVPALIVLENGNLISKASGIDEIEKEISK
jgi:glutaredoxin